MRVRYSPRGVTVALPHRAAVALGMLPVLALTAACGGGSSSGGTLAPSGSLGAESGAPGGGTAAPTAPPSTMPVQQIDQTVLQRYREYQRVYKQAFATNDPSLLATVATDPLLSQLTKDIRDTAAKGEVWRFTNVLNPKIMGRTKDSSSVVVLDCVRTLAAYRFSAKTGKRLGAYKGGVYRYQVLMKYDANTWKVFNARQWNKC